YLPHGEMQLNSRTRCVPELVPLAAARDVPDTPFLGSNMTKHANDGLQIDLAPVLIVLLPSLQGCQALLQDEVANRDIRRLVARQGGEFEFVNALAVVPYPGKVAVLFPNVHSCPMLSCVVRMGLVLKMSTQAGRKV